MTLWCLVVKDVDGHPREWCGHQHPTAQEAHDCPFYPRDGTWIVPKTYGSGMFVERDFNPDLHLPCAHELHPRECSRCIQLRVMVSPCSHLDDPVTCERCFLIDDLGLESSYEHQEEDSSGTDDTPAELRE